MLLTLLFIGRFWSYDNSCDDYNYADDYYDQNHDFVYMLIFIIFITCNIFSGMALWHVWNSVSFWERNYDCHKQICSGLNMYRCATCGKMYQSKKSLCAHRRKHHIDDICHFTFFVENVTYIKFLTYILYMWNENFLIMCMLWYCIIENWKWE